ncbi:MAG: hypothetical protein HY329_20320 [Chloroflexi bacterium]|nr:hypothetical protein [Chloroflexota bacterium]
MRRPRPTKNPRPTRSYRAFWPAALVLTAILAAAGFGLWQNAKSVDAQASGPLGWLVGESWVVEVTQPGISVMDTHVDEVTHRYRYTVTAVPSRNNRDFVIEVSHADPQQQPESARGPLFEAHYQLRGNGLALAGIKGKNNKGNGNNRTVGAQDEDMVVGQYFPRFIVPERPNEDGTPSSRAHRGRGGVQVSTRRHSVDGGNQEWAQGDPWWVAYEKPGRYRAELVQMTRAGNRQP